MKKTQLVICLLFICVLNLSAQQGDFPELTGPYLSQKFPGDVPEMFAPGLVSSPEAKEMGITWMPNMKEFYFTRQDPSDSDRKWAIWYSKEANGIWTRPEIVGFSGTYLDIAPFITYDGKYMLFYRGSRSDTTFKTGTYIAERTGDKWTEPRFFADAYVLNTADFKTFYCTEGKEDRQIYHMTYADGEFSEKKPLEGQLNSPFFDAHGMISPDGYFMLFDSDRPGGIDKIDMYVSFRKGNNSWSEGINLGENINRGHFTIPSFSPDGKYIFINSDRDIYWVSAKVIDDLKNK